MVYCRNCGAEITENDKFCHECGASLEPKQETATNGEVRTENYQL